MTIWARYPGKCAKCGGPIQPGEQINWDKATKPETIALGTEYVEVYAATMDKLRGETSARWWIDNRDTADMMLYNACDDVLRKHKAYR